MDNNQEKAYDQKAQQLNQKEQMLVKQENELKDKQNKLNKDIQALAKRENELKDEQNKLNKDMEDLAKKRLDAEHNFPTLFKETFKTEIENLDKERQSLNKAREQLNEERRSLTDDQIKLKDEMNKIRENITDERLRWVAAQKAKDEEISQKRVEAIEDLQKELEKRREENNQKAEEIFTKREKDLEKKEQDLANKQKELEDKEQDLGGLRRDLEFRLASQDKILEQREAELENQYCIQIDALRDDLTKRGVELANCQKRLIDYEYLSERADGESIETLTARVQRLTDERDSLKKKLINALSEEEREEYNKLKTKYDKLKTDYDELKTKSEEFAEEKQELAQLKRENKSFKEGIEALTEGSDALRKENTHLNERLQRFFDDFTEEDREKARNKRIKAIESVPYISHVPAIVSDGVNDVNEKDWLSTIEKKCEEFGLKFPRRIINAFHTSLKSAEMSPLTVLAGVSGTGKSQLPKLYSAFGGINFLSVPVLPNWDSPEAMLGFFNSIDNRFDAQAILNFLAQAQLEDSYPHSLKKHMNLILLDEMNLAHVELYYADFLSKLEERRGLGTGQEPFLDIKLGSGLEPYKLQLGRNVLWAGTINQDETTKTLSDKVLDRGILINFPRPTNLESRSTLKPLNNYTKDINNLDKKSWNNWVRFDSTKSFSGDEIKKYKQFTEEINDKLSHVGRALGHRVWQSIEFYMANHPDVIYAEELGKDKNHAMKIAFEDQLVQKVMPKLRGIETDALDAKTKCLDPIKKMLEDGGYEIVRDFEDACKFGYGHFNWCTAHYLEEAIEDNTSKSVEESKESQEPNNSEE